MAAFTIRIELNHANETDAYENLHAAMTRQGFTRTIMDDNVVYHLPTAEYNIISSLTIEQILMNARTAANSVGKEYQILITEAVRRKIFNLRRVMKH